MKTAEESTGDLNAGAGTKKRRGQKRDPGKAREAILAAARTEFGRSGYESATLRSIAAAAGVDVALVSYYFGSKSDLFVASLDLPVNPATALSAILDEGVEGSAARMLRRLLVVWDEPATGAPLVAMIRSLPTQGGMLRDFIEQRLMGSLTKAIDEPDAELRAAAFTSQVLGLVLERYVLGVEPLASASHDEIAALFAPTLQRYLDGAG
jgi:AcrR family transcriptional regulator